MSSLIAHETGHFWWTGAETDSWHDWLNEAFAEYANMLYITFVQSVRQSIFNSQKESTFCLKESTL
jgi:aminopeptidase N